MNPMQQTAAKAPFTASFNPLAVLASLRLALRRAEARQRLLDLNDHMLRDIGLTRSNVMADLI